MLLWQPKKQANPFNLAAEAAIILWRLWNQFRTCYDES